MLLVSLVNGLARANVIARHKPSELLACEEDKLTLTEAKKLGVL